MCGFAGIFHPFGNSVSANLLTNMGEIIKHRGPDDSGEIFINTNSGLARNTFYNAANLGLCFRRLAIIDLSQAGHQPMTNKDQSVWIVFNGEIYNYPELKANLKNKNREFIGNSDTEVILALYEEIGEKVFTKLNGMFAIAIWDQRKNELFLARDRIGIKPLYYTFVSGALIFGSEIKQLLLYPGAKRGFDPYGVVEHFTFQYCLQDRTTFEGIKLIEAGHYLKFSAENPTKIKSKTQYWDLNFSPTPNRHINNFASDLRECLTSAIKRQTRSDVNVGAFLSSGMDSGSICAVSKEIINNLNSFTCGFDVTNLKGQELFFDESVAARKLSHILATDHHEIFMQPKHLQELLPKTVWHMEDPRVGISYQILAMAEKVKNHVTVVLSGTGGDELFGGYHWRYNQMLKINDPKKFDAKYYEIWNRLSNDNNRWNIFSPEIFIRTNGFSPYEGYAAVMKNCPTTDPLHRALYFDVKGFLHGLLLLDDKLNMAHSVESRVPFLDNEVIDLASQIPAHFKYNGGITKRVLKKALKGLLPDEILHRRKQGFTPPEASWFRTHSAQYLNDTLLAEKSLARGWFNKKAINAIIEEHFSGEHNHRFLLWSLLCFEHMHQLFME